MKFLLKSICFFSLFLGLFACQPKDNSIVENPKKDKTYSLGYGDYITLQEESEEGIIEKISDLSQIITSSTQDIFQSKYQKGALEFFDLKNLISLQLELSKDTLKDLDRDYSLGNKESYRKCNLEIKFSGLTFHFEDVGIRQKGNSSRGNILDDKENINLRHYKLSFSETFDDEFRDHPEEWKDEKALEYRENRTFFGLEKLILRWNRNQDSTYLREYYANEIYRNNHVLAPHCNLVRLDMKIQDQVENLGVYLAMEDINKDFIKRNLIKDSAGGDLYKLGWTDVGAKLNSLDLGLFGIEKQIKKQNEFIQITYPYDLKTNKKKSQHKDIHTFIEKILATSTIDFYEFLKESTVYNSVISYLAVSYLLGDPDDLRGNFNNTYLYFTKDSSQALFIPTDQDRALGSTGGTGNPTNHHGAYNEPFDTKTGYGSNDMPFFEKSIFLGGNSQIQKDYIEAIQQVLAAGWFNFQTFEGYYNEALKYKDFIHLGRHVNGKEITFSLLEANHPEDAFNLSIEVYLSLKKETFLNKDWLKEVEEEGFYSPYYLRGEMNGWNGIERKYQLKLVDNIPTLLCNLSSGQSFKIASQDWKVEWNYSSLIDSTHCISVGNEKNIRVKEDGTYKIQILDEKLEITRM